MFKRPIAIILALSLLIPAGTVSADWSASGYNISSWVLNSAGDKESFSFSEPFGLESRSERFILQPGLLHFSTESGILQPPADSISCTIFTLDSSGIDDTYTLSEAVTFESASVGYVMQAGFIYCIMAAIEPPVTPDTTPPTIVLTQPPSLTNQDVTLAYSVSDDVTLEEDITIEGDDSPYAEDGEYSITLRAIDEAGNERTSNAVTFTVDKTPPAEVVVTDDGESTLSKTQLHAIWTESSDALSGVKEYEYAIGTSVGTTDIAGWTSAGLNTEVTHTGLSMTHGPIYYISVRVTDNAGNISEVATADGIADGFPPDITNIDVTSTNNFHQGAPVTIQVSANDIEGDEIEYRYLINGAEAQAWTTNNSLEWNPGVSDIGLNTIRIEARADREDGTPKQEQQYIFRMPITPEE